MRSAESNNRLAPSAAQVSALWLAGAFIALAGLGAAHYIAVLTPWTPSPESAVSGLFHAPVLHIVVHLVLGAAGLLAAGSGRTCVIFLAAVGATVLMFAGYRLVDESPASTGLVPVEGADVWLHVVLAVGAIAGCLTALPRRPASQ
ncbi:DUF4383 domain-containing protein [Kribbella sp. NPDC000426]|uniref:DUF4383 domain-containing protein n=1 Tax=Kribbella sp. NPDC000426 TaxID=3154255 RepID=UPI00332DC6FB